MNNIGLSCSSIWSVPLDYENNKLKIVESIKKCKKLNCGIRIGGELELCGVNCKSSFKEIVDLQENCWYYLSEILKEKYDEKENLTDNILCFVSMPVYFHKKMYNCELAIYNNEIIFISPKENINKNDEKDYFASYEKNSFIEEKENNIKFNHSDVKIFHNNFEKYVLPQCIQNITNQKETYFGNAILEINGLVIAHIFLDDLIKVESNLLFENSNDILCESLNKENEVFKRGELLFQKDHKKLENNNKKINLNSVDILLVNGYVINELQLFNRYFIELMNLSKLYPNMTLCFSNNSGCDNNFFKFDGFSFICKNNKVLTKNARFTFSDIQVASVNVTYVINKEKLSLLQKEKIDTPYNDNMKKGNKNNDLSLLKIVSLNNIDMLNGNCNNNHMSVEGIFSFNNDLNISIKNSDENILNHLPAHFNWKLYGQENKNLFEIFKNHHQHNNVYEYSYEFNGNKYVLHNIYEELSFNCALFLWYILCLTNAKGFVLAISGGIDSSFVACMVYILSIMIEITLKENPDLLDNNFCSLELNEKLFIKKVKNLLIDQTCRKDICNKLLNTISFPSKNSSENTKCYSEQLSKDINSYHTTYSIEHLYEFLKSAGEEFLGEDMKFESQGGSTYQDVCLQNIQSRSRMLLTYFFSTLICHKRYFKKKLFNEFLIALATGNLDESITGYYTKYDCSSADINIVGNVSKLLIKETMCHIANDPFYKLQIINKINQYHPSAELKPLDNKQTDESELNLKYIEIKLLTILKNNFFLGPSSMYYYLSNYFWTNMPKTEILNKIKIFFTRMLKNTHKLFILPPSIISESCGLHTPNFLHYANIDFDALKKKLNL